MIKMISEFNAFEDKQNLKKSTRSHFRNSSRDNFSLENSHFNNTTDINTSMLRKSDPIHFKKKSEARDPHLEWVRTLNTSIRDRITTQLSEVSIQKTQNSFYKSIF